MRFNPYASDRKGHQALSGLHQHLASGPLDPATRLLVELRVSQINGCAFCLAMHGDEARQAEVPATKLDTLAGWRENPDFTPDERAALALAEAVTRIGDGQRVDDSTWAAARDQFTDEELAALLYAIGLVNVFNRVNVAIELPSTLYRPRR